VRAAIVGAAGYIGGELLRLLLFHEHVEVVQATSDRYAGWPVATIHPNLRGLTQLRFTPRDELGDADVFFLALPHGAAMGWAGLRDREPATIVDLSSDFRLREPATYAQTYGREHARPELLDAFVPGIPELHREELRGATRISVPGCIANAVILALRPLVAAGVVASPPVADARVGSSGGGPTPSLATHHPERSGASRVYAPAGHRHEAEVAQTLGLPVRLTVTAIEAVRGVQVVAHVTPRDELTERAVWDLYREAYDAEPFVRLVSQRRGVYQLPEPKILSGSNFCDVGFALDQATGDVVVVAALDNLGKGGSGNGVQCLNVAAGFEESSGLRFPGLHPI
jgi:N-acetyl-gamma-glutamyl-phosphate/LysW-gamma-L-alpha-aminoadipyl-6-phosphate reductase